jgi:hypothetical protein
MEWQEPSEELAAKTAHLKEKLVKLESEMQRLATMERLMLALTAARWRPADAAPAWSATMCYRLDQLLHFAVGQVLPGPQIGVFRPARGNCSIYSDWRDQPELRFCHDKCAPLDAHCSYIE